MRKTLLLYKRVMLVYFSCNSFIISTVQWNNRGLVDQHNSGKLLLRLVWLHLSPLLLDIWVTLSSVFQYIGQGEFKLKYQLKLKTLYIFTNSVGRFLLTQYNTIVRDLQDYTSHIVTHLYSRHRSIKCSES